MNVLIVDDSELTLDLIEMYLESYFDISPMIAKSGNEAISFLKDDKPVDVILSDYNMPDGSGGDLFKFYQEQELQIPFALLTAEPLAILKEFEGATDQEQFYFLQKPYNGEGFKETLSSIFVNETHEEQVTPEYMKVKIKKFLKYVNCSVDIFLKLTDKKMIKISNRIDKASSDQLERFIEKGAEYIYMTPVDFEIFIETGMDEANTNLRTSTGVQLVDIQKDAVETIHSAMEAFGVSKKAIETASNCFDATLASLQKNSALKNLIPSFKKGDDNFKYSLSVASSYFSIAMGLKVDFCDTSSLEKLAMAALFQDISLQDPKLIKVTSVESEDFLSFSKSEKKTVLEHLANSVSLLDKNTDISIDVKNMVLQHHERPDAAGFPRKLPATSIVPLSCIFILSHELANRILSENEIESNLDLIKASFESRYDEGNFKKVFASFSSVFKKL